MENIKTNSKHLKSTFLNDCPNCWGYQEYNGLTFKSVFHKSTGWIQEYFNKFLNNKK